MDDAALERLKLRLEEAHSWPSLFLFKFIVPAQELGPLTALFPGVTPVARVSKNGRYIGVTVEVEMSSSEAVIAIYRDAAKIPGLLAL